MSINVLIACPDTNECNSIKKVLREFGVEHEVEVSAVNTQAAAEYASRTMKPDIIFSDESFGLALFSLLEKKGVDSAKVLISSQMDFDSIKTAINTAGVCRLVKRPWEDKDLRWALEGGLEHLDVSRVHGGLVEKAKARSAYLEKLRSMLESQEKEKVTSINIYSGMLRSKKDECEVMNKVLSHVPGLNTVDEVEEFLCSTIAPFTGITDVNIILSGSGVNTASGKGGISLPLFCSGCMFGHIVFFKPGVDAFLFSQEQLSFLDKVSDVVAISIERILRLSVLEKLKKQWDAVFSSISDPIIVIDPEYKILRANKAFEELVEHDLESIVGKKCFQVFNCRDGLEGCEGCNARDTFKTGQASGSEVSFRNDKKRYNAWTYPVVENGAVTTAVQFYKDVSEQVIFREKLLYSEKLAELGILAGSVAHEINNPIGGALALLQIMMRDVQEGSPIYADLLEMEKAAKRCKQIVDNLLHFSRRSRDEDVKEIELTSIFSSMMPLVELQIRHENIDLSLYDNSGGSLIFGVFNEIVQVFLNVINTSVELISKTGRKGKIKIFASADGASVFINIEDDGIALDLNALCGGGEFKSLALFVAKRIVSAHNGRITFERDGDRNVYRILFPRKLN